VTLPDEALSLVAQAGGLEPVVGRTLQWHSAGYGTYLDEALHASASCEVLSVAGAQEFGATEGVWRHVHAAARQVLAGAAFLPNCDALELRYIAEPRLGDQTRIRAFLTAKTLWQPPVAAEGVVEAACAALPTGFGWARTQDGPRLGERRGSGAGETVVELRRHEEVTTPQWNFVPTEFYYSIEDAPGDGVGWPAFWSLFAKVSRPVEISVLFRATELDWEEVDVLGRITSDLSLYGSTHHDYDVFGNQVEYPADANATRALESWNRRLALLQRPLLGRVAVRGDVDAAHAVATALASAVGGTQAQGDAVPYPMRVEAPLPGSYEEQLAFEAFDWLEIFPWGGLGLWEMDEAPRGLRRLPYLYGLDEAAGMAILPVPDEQGAPGFARARRIAGKRAGLIGDPSEGQPGLPLGHLLHHGEQGGQVRIPLAALNRHLLVVGTTGSGKTTTVLSLLAELWRAHEIPFVAIEPARKKEYRGLMSTPGLEQLEVLTLGREDISPVRLNPMAPPPGVRCESHASSVSAALKMAMPMFPPLPQLLTRAIEHAYERAGWDYEATIEDNVAPPTLRTLLSSFSTVFEAEGYIGEAHNIGVAFKVRLEDLLTGSKGRVLDTVESSDFGALMHRPVVIELGDVADPSDKAVLSALLLEQIKAAAQARGSTGGELRHVTVVEEAHHLLARADVDTQRSSSDGDTTRAEAVRSFCEAIAELRAQGEGFVLCSQKPSELADAAVDNTNSRIIHSLLSADDRKDVLDDLDTSELDREAAARLRRGEAIVKLPDYDDAVIVKVQSADGVDSGRRLSDEVVISRMAGARAATHALMPYPLCSASMCPQGCSYAVRREGRAIAKAIGAEAHRLWQEAAPRTIDALDPITAVVVDEAEGDARLSYCASAHLAATGDAFDLRRRRNIGPQIEEAITQAGARR
jgi:hypothetical protein